MFALARPGAAAGDSVISATLNFPRVGAWSADLQVDSQAPLAGKVDLLLGDTRWKGQITRAAVFGGRLRARVIGGGDGLRAVVQARHYTSPTIGVVLRDVARDVGEAISPWAFSSVTGVQLEHWTTLALPAARAIRCLLDRAPAGTVWRHLPDGSIWLGQDTFTDSGLTDFAVLDERPEDDLVELQLVSTVVYPGTRLGVWKVDSAQVVVTGSAVRATIWTVP